jgi:hypothetical protein
VGVQAEDIGDNSQSAALADDIGKHTSQHARSDASKPSLSHYSKFLVPSSMSSKPEGSKTSASAKFAEPGDVGPSFVDDSSMHGQDPMSITPVTNQASAWVEDAEPLQVLDKETDKLFAFADGRSSPIALTAIFASLFALSAMLGIRIYFGIAQCFGNDWSQSPALATTSESIATELHSSAALPGLAATSADGILEPQEVYRSGGWVQPSSQSLSALTVCYSTGWGNPSALRTTTTARHAVDYEAELYRSSALDAQDADLAEWCEKWARRAIMGEGAGGTSVKLTTPVKLSRQDKGVLLLFMKSGSGYDDKDKAKEDKWNDSDDKPAPPPKAGTGGVDVSADGGAIVATRCAYEGSGIVKQMSEDKIVTQLRKDVSAAFG